MLLAENLDQRTSRLRINSRSPIAVTPSASGLRHRQAAESYATAAAAQPNHQLGAGKYCAMAANTNPSGPAAGAVATSKSRDRAGPTVSVSTLRFQIRLRGWLARARTLAPPQTPPTPPSGFTDEPHRIRWCLVQP